MKKINLSKWKPIIEDVIKYPSGFHINGVGGVKTSSEHGRSKGNVSCPCCDSITEVYLWSFSGGGKKCSGCNVLLGNSGAFVEHEKISKLYTFKETKLIKNQ